MHSIARSEEWVQSPAAIAIRERRSSVAFCTGQANSNILALSQDIRILWPSERFLGKSNII